jgi:hypothetical protein
MEPWLRGSCTALRCLNKCACPCFRERLPIFPIGSSVSSSLSIVSCHFYENKYLETLLEIYILSPPPDTECYDLVTSTRN